MERQNLTMGMNMQGFARLTNGFSEKLENHANAVPLYLAYYNLVRSRQSLRMIPAMAADVADHLWPMADLVANVEAAEAKPNRPATYRKRAKAA